LIGSDETPERVGVETRIGVRDQCERDSVDARVTGERTVGEFGKFVIVTLGKIVSDLAQLFFDDVIVIDQPLSGGRNRAALAECFDEGFVSRLQQAAVLRETR